MSENADCASAFGQDISTFGFDRYGLCRPTVTATATNRDADIATFLDGDVGIACEPAGAAAVADALCQHRVRAVAFGADRAALLDLDLSTVAAAAAGTANRDCHIGGLAE